MAGVIIFCAADSRIRPVERAPAMAAIRTLETAYQVKRWIVRDPLDYSRGLDMWWRDPRTLVNIEHDMAPEVWQIQALIDCPEPLCACVYWLAPASTGRRDVILSANPSSLVPEWALTPAIGCCKIASSKRKVSGPPLCQYRDVEYWLWKLCGGPWHLHYPPVVHYHGFREAGIEQQRTAVQAYRERYLSDQHRTSDRAASGDEYAVSESTAY